MKYLLAILLFFAVAFSFFFSNNEEDAMDAEIEARFAEIEFNLEALCQLISQRNSNHAEALDLLTQQILTMLQQIELQNQQMLELLKALGALYSGPTFDVSHPVADFDFGATPMILLEVRISLRKVSAQKHNHPRAGVKKIYVSPQAQTWKFFFRKRSCKQQLPRGCVREGGCAFMRAPLPFVAGA